MILIDASKKRYYKGCTHAHTALSDGKKGYYECIADYRAAGFDFLAVTDHWRMSEERMAGDMLVMRGCEYNFDAPRQALHIVALLPARAEPDITQNTDYSAAVTRINEVGGLAILAHPAWSMNTPDIMLSLSGVTTAEIFNAVSGMPWGNDRALSGTQLDICANHGKLFKFACGDDTHYYTGEVGASRNMVAADELTGAAIISAMKRGDSYCTQAPEIYFAEFSKGALRIECSPARHIAFYGNSPWEANRCVSGDNITSAEYKVNMARETYVRCEIIDSENKRAWLSPFPTFLFN